MIDKHLSSQANQALVKEMLDIVANDSENLERTLPCITDNCVWVMEPGGTEYHGFEQVNAFVRIAMSGRTHDAGQHKIEITNWFADADNLCLEYTHGAMLTGRFTAGFKGKIKTGVSRCCITYHLRDGKIDRVHEYIDSTSWWLNVLMPIALANLHRLTMKQVAKGQAFRPLGIAIVAILMVCFGLAEVVTGFTHNFFGVSTTLGAVSAFSAAGIGALYAVAGVLIWTMRQWAAALALLCLMIVIVGRVALVVTGLFPVSSFEQTFAIIAGTTIAVIFTIYIGLKWRLFT
jgi:hypothetical protein